MINVTEPFLPGKEEYQNYVEEIWNRNWLTNNGPLVNELELNLKRYLNLDHLIYVSNGTIALQIAIAALDIQGEIITTPFSFIATTSSIVWQNCTPKFVDIDPESFNIDPKQIEGAITDKTSAILATHVFGNPCDVEAINQIAEKYNLKVIYDAAHAFGTRYKGESIFKWGDFSVVSFHATKLYHTIEGGAIMSNEAEHIKNASYMRNFGFDGYYHYSGVGINGKNSEFHAAMGLCNLKYIDAILNKRKKDSEYYDYYLDQLSYKKQKILPNTEYNYSYYPIVFPTEELCVKTLNFLAEHQIFARRYFYPSLSKLEYLKDKKSMPVTESISNNILCLPLSYQLRKSEIDMISRLILRVNRY